METPGNPENGDRNQNKTPNTPTIICEPPIRLEPLPCELEPNEDQCSTGTDVPETILKINIVDEKEENRLSLPENPGKTVTPGDPENLDQNKNETPNTPTIVSETPIKLEPLPSELECNEDQCSIGTDVPGTILKVNVIDEIVENRLSLPKTPAKTVSFILPTDSNDEDAENRNSPVLRPKKPKTNKQGHRRESAGVVTYKKIATSQLMGSIQLGLQQTIGITGSVKFDSLHRHKDVLLKDFHTIETSSFPKNGSTTTVAHNYKEFKFRTFAPVAFNNFRQLYDIDPPLYLSSLCSCPMTELSNPGASGSIFYRTKDDNFICKTVFKKEALYLQQILAGYWINLKQNPETYLPKFFGLYCFTCSTKNIRIVVMNNLMPSDMKIHHTFDMKGSTYKRTASKKERKKNSPVYKDLDFLEMYPNGIRLNAETRTKLLDTLEKDCRVLESFEIMDYSLLLSIHNLDLKNDDHDGEENETEEKIAESPSDVPTPPNFLYEPSNENIRQSEVLNSSRIPIMAKNEKEENILLFIGIIDILQSFDLAKKLEHYTKSIVQDGKQISVTNPDFYASRFLKFMREKVFLPKIESTIKRVPGGSKKRISGKSNTSNPASPGLPSD
jgi:1-phosphatidylinositol-4-phosphate 5-kinase